MEVARMTHNPLGAPGKYSVLAISVGPFGQESHRTCRWLSPPHIKHTHTYPVSDNLFIPTPLSSPLLCALMHYYSVGYQRQNLDYLPPMR